MACRIHSTRKLRTNAGIFLIGPLGTNFNEILIKIYTFSFKKMHLKMSSGKWRPFCPSLIVLTQNNESSAKPLWPMLLSRITAARGWGLLSQFPPFRYFPHFPLLSKQTLAIEYRVYIWQV